MTRTPRYRVSLPADLVARIDAVRGSRTRAAEIVRRLEWSLSQPSIAQTPVRDARCGCAPLLATSTTARPSSGGVDHGGPPDATVLTVWCTACKRVVDGELAEHRCSDLRSLAARSSVPDPESWEYVWLPLDESINWTRTASVAGSPTPVAKGPAGERR